ncbi:hypothetical protein [Palleronia caenipelagi]|uniref:Lipoprotein n=1 Tax=Palleronia caenipelagi TaxID=2489174 RepID=A0A547Q2N4_9RHOB|nr:hypothetical protein [Palleronia caenipelagi]TRD20621.1 hypothetical protein FEV53_10000 [Palleronia caenipelagi]
MRVLILSALTLGLLMGCNSSSEPANGITVDQGYVDTVSRESGLSREEVETAYRDCVKGGGKPIFGGFGQPACETPTLDAGKSCTQNSDCDSFCLAETATCAPKKPLSGCTSVLPSPGRPATICVD